MVEKKNLPSAEEVSRSIEEGFKKYVKPYWAEIEKCRVPSLGRGRIYIFPKSNK